MSSSDSNDLDDATLPDEELGEDQAARPARKQTIFRFRRSILRGLIVVLPPLLTIVILTWMFNTVRQYVLTPVEDGIRDVLVWRLADIRQEPQGQETRRPELQFDGQPYRRLASGDFIPRDVWEWLRAHPAESIRMGNGWDAYRSYLRERYLRPAWMLPILGVLFVIFLYLLGKLLAAGAWDVIERGLLRLPLVRSVYRSVKKITNFIFTENQQHYKRVVAIEYPRKGIWSIGLVTSDGISTINQAAREPTVTVILPGSPTPVTGYCVMVPQRETYDLRLTIDQALQFYMSCGVSVPAHQQPGQTTPAIEVIAK